MRFHPPDPWSGQIKRAPAVPAGALVILLSVHGIKGLQSSSQTGEMLLQLHKSLLVINCFSFEASLFTAGSLVLPVSLHSQTVAGAAKIHRLGTTLLL